MTVPFGPSFRRRAQWRVEAWLAAVLFALCRALGPIPASNLGGRLMRTIGPMLPVSRVARRNLAIAFPDRGHERLDRMVRAMWDNLGRTAAELAHLPEIAARADTASGVGWRVSDPTRVPPPGASIVFVSGHFANWEVLPGAAARLGHPFAIVYRAIGNPHIDRMVQRFRAQAMPGSGAVLLPKGSQGARGALGQLRGGGSIALLADQKQNDGIEACLFGRPAMTAPAAAQLALRFGCPVIPVRCRRDGPARFVLDIEPPLLRPDTGERQQDIRLLTQAINDRLEAWAREHPEHWLWVHRRFDKAIYRR